MLHEDRLSCNRQTAQTIRETSGIVEIPEKNASREDVTERKAADRRG